MTQNSGRKIGPNLKRLMIIAMARIAVPPKSPNPMASAIEALKDSANVARRALEWCDEAMAAVRSAPDNPYGSDEETIAGAILDKLGEDHE